MSDKDDGGVEQETVEMEAPVWEVHFPGVGPLWFPEDEYDLAYQHATGCRIGDDPADPKDEDDIEIVDFEETVEVPIADV